MESKSAFFELCHELLDEVVGGNPIVCGGLATAFPAGGGSPGVVEVAAPSARGSDVYVGGSLFYDCPEYEG